MTKSDDECWKFLFLIGGLSISIGGIYLFGLWLEYINQLYGGIGVSVFFIILGGCICILAYVCGRWYNE